jgi:hypothetical protein
MVQYKHIIFLVLFIMLMSTPQAYAATFTECYQELCASMTVPDSVAPNTDFEISIEGRLVGETLYFDEFPFMFLENAQWYYNDFHIVSTNGVSAGPSENFLNHSQGHMEQSYVLNKPPGSYTYTFVFGLRNGWSTVGRWYDVAVEVEINTAAKETRRVAFDIKPDSCRNPFNIKSKGVFPAAILGSDDFDVRTVVPEDVRVAGVRPVQYTYEDIAQPLESSVAMSAQADCSQATPDGHLDLVLKFRSEDIQQALIETQGLTLNTGDVVPVKMTAPVQSQSDSMVQSEIEGEDVIQVITKNWQLRL